MNCEVLFFMFKTSSYFSNSNSLEIGLRFLFNNALGSLSQRIFMKDGCFVLF